ncbi:MAG: PEP-CTERM sorting domain-containing protein [Myxococcota bacterium]|nr:PEP-CTERM sorting domain-containing protein [Myxococcota bacterium]
MIKIPTGSALRIVTPTLLLLLASPSGALELDWTTNPWPGTSVRSATYTVGAGDVIVTVTDPNDAIITGQFGPPSIETNTHTTPGTDPARPHSLFIKTDENTSTPYVTIDILFTHAAGVTGVEFSIHDIDLRPLQSFFGFPISGYTDAIQVTASDGTNVYDPTNILAPTATPTWSTVGANTVVGNTANAEDSLDGTAVIEFDQVINSLSIQYRNDLTQGQLQWIGFSSILFFEAPEPSSALLLGLGLAFLARSRRLRR